MKKILFALIMALPWFAFAQVSTQKVVNTATIYSSTSPVTFGANFNGLGTDYLLNNQTLTGNGSIITRSLGDARYSAFGAATTNSNFFADGSTNSFYDLIVRRYLIGDLVQTNGNFSMTGNQPIHSLISTNTNRAIGGGSLARTEYYVPGYPNGSIIGMAGSTNATIIGSLPGDFTFRASSGTRFAFGNGTVLAGYWDFSQAVHHFVLLNSTFQTSGSISGNVFTNAGASILNGNITGFGSDNTLNNQTLTGNGSILTRGTADSRYQTGGAWYMGIGAVTGGNLLNGNRDVLSGSGFGNGYGIAQAAGVIGKSTLYQLPDFVAGHSVVFKGYFVTRVSETNYSSAAVVTRFINSYITNLATFAETVPYSGDGSQGNVAINITTPVTEGRRQYVAIATNAIPSNALAPVIQWDRQGGDGSDTMPTNMYQWRLEWKMIP